MYVHKKHTFKNILLCLIVAQEFFAKIQFKQSTFLVLNMHTYLHSSYSSWFLHIANRNTCTFITLYVQNMVLNF